MAAAVGHKGKKHKSTPEKQVEVDVQKIFLTPPRRLGERAILLGMLVVTFMIFFGPLKFSQVPPLEAALTAMLPAVSLSWGWIVFLRYRFRKAEYLKEI
ncbi:MAG: hypothetical protein OEL90_08150 [Acidaminobacter sp.]|nr:hypothetical protein [Acidaminobacter sp.]MDK9711153.1 hypothetical protein [Acidaminobacter sp.]